MLKSIGALYGIISHPIESSVGVAAAATLFNRCCIANSAQDLIIDDARGTSSSTRGVRRINHMKKRCLFEETLRKGDIAVTEEVPKLKSLALDAHGPLATLMRRDQQEVTSPTTSSSSNSMYNDKDLLKMWWQGAKGDMSDPRTQLLRLLRRHNYSLPCLKGQAIQATVLRVGHDSVMVDPGFFGVSEVPRSAVTLAQIVALEGTRLEDRHSSDDVRAGDIIAIRIESLHTPYGDMQVEALQLDSNLRISTVWRELAKAKQAGHAVQGRVLNACNGGYAVGIAGIVALLPYGRFTMETVSRIGLLESFFVEGIDESRSLLMVADTRKGSSRRLI